MAIVDLTLGEDYCLEFYYHMHGADINAIGVGVDFDSEPQYFITGGRGRGNAMQSLRSLANEKKWISHIISVAL